jgi:hypothetical protein
MTYINKIKPNKNIQKNFVNGVIITFFILIVYFMFFNNISLFTVTNFLFDSDLGRIVLLVTLIAISSNNLFLGIIFLCILIFFYEYQYANISKYNKANYSMNDNYADGSNINSVDNINNVNNVNNVNNRNVTIQDILNLENNISSKQSNNSLNFGNSSDMNNFHIMQINPSSEGTFNNNYAPFL